MFLKTTFVFFRLMEYHIYSRYRHQIILQYSNPGRTREENKVLLVMKSKSLVFQVDIKPKFLNDLDTEVLI